MKFKEIVEKLASDVKDYNILSDPALSQVASLEEATIGTITYIEGPRFAHLLETTAASAIILPADASLADRATNSGLAWLTTDNPRLFFAQTINLFYKPFRPVGSIHPTAVISEDVVLGKDVAIGAHVVINSHVQIGDGVCIHPNVVIYPGVTVGDRTTLHANCTIHERTIVGADCVIHSGAVIGSEGFGFVPTKEGWYKMEQSGFTVLENGVEVGCNSTIDRPAVGRTLIKSQTKLDNMVHIAHGCTVGSGCALAAQVGLAGGVEIGDRVILAGQVGVANQVKIGKGVIVSAQSGVHSDVEAGQVISGSPAVPNKLYLKVSAIYKRLPEMYQLFKEIAK
jgi:UDP-3-O-[3-hydroxymyristoyl] glucosamine N-acyltransferase